MAFELEAHLVIPSREKSKGSVCLLRDEFSDVKHSFSVAEVTNLLGRELAPLNVWLGCAVEFYRQGFKSEYQEILKEIVNTIETEPDVKNSYGGNNDFESDMLEIYCSLAAHSLSELQDLHDMGSAALGSEGHGARESTIKDEITKMLRSAQDVEKNVNLGSQAFYYRQVVGGFYNLFTGQLRPASTDLEKLQKGRKKGFDYIYNMGMGLISFAKNELSVALDFFIHALSANPESGGSVRMVIAYCCFKLGFYDKARLATKKALEMDPSNVDGFVILALLEQVEAVKDKDKASRAQHRAAAADLCSFALMLNPNCSTALINKANHSFCSFKLLSGDECAICVDEQNIQVSFANGNAVRVGDEVHVVSGQTVHRVTHIQRGEDAVALRLQPGLPRSMVGTQSEIKIKELGMILETALRAFQTSQLPHVHAESFYLQGRVHHAQGDLREARRLYEEANRLWPEMTLPNFALGQLTLSQSIATSKPNYEKSLEYFEKVKQQSPDDKDTEAFVIFLRGITKGEVCGIEKIKEVAATFPYESELWISQAQLRQKSQSDYPAALRCYFNALDIIRDKNTAPHEISSVLSNIAVLQHGLGRLADAVEYSKLALAEVQRSPAALDPATGREFVNPVFKSSDFENVFYHWGAEPFCEVTRRGPSGSFFLVPRANTNVNLTMHLTPGDDILIGDIMHVVEGATPDSFTARSPVRVFSVEAGSTFQVRRKIVGHNFNDGTLTLCFDYARILEDAGRSRSAAELYIELCKNHPSFIDCYLRLGHIAHRLGKHDDAFSWIHRALQVDAENLDALAFLGELHNTDGSSEAQSSAKNTFEKMLKITQQQPDVRANLALGNLYFHASEPEEKRNLKEKAEAHLKTSYKYFHKVLVDDQRNVFAANGLGIVLAQKEEYGPAREVFQKARETNSLNDDICNNLAHVHLFQDRLTEAEHAYQANLKALARSNRHIEVGAISNLCDCMAFAQFKHGRHEDSLRSLLRGIHQEPNIPNDGFKSWYNIAVVRLTLAHSIMSNKKTQKTATSVLNATSELLNAQNLFRILATKNLSELHKAKEMEMHCQKLSKTFTEHLQDAFRTEEKKKAERKRQELEHAERQREKEEKKQRELDLAEQAKREKEKAAEDRSKRLEELKEKWVAIPQSNTGKKDKKGTNASSADDAMEPEEDDDGLAFLDDISSNVKPKNDTDDLFGDGDSDDGAEDIFGSVVAAKKRKLVEDDEEEPEDSKRSKSEM